MKKIEAIIRPEKFNIVRDALTELGYPGMTVIEVKGHGSQKGISEVWRGRRYRVDLLSKIKLEITVKDSDVEKIVNTIIPRPRLWPGMYVKITIRRFSIG